ncbi:MAG: nitroreductase family protein [Myxococcota bacterium]
MPATLDLTPDQLLSTTRAVRKRLDYDRPVPLELAQECVELALQAPSGSNQRGWHFVLVGDPEKRQQIGDLYRQGFVGYRDMPVSAHALAKQAEGSDVAVMNQVVGSAEALAENLHRAPFLVIPCVDGRLPAIEGPMASIAYASTYGSILPAFWSFMLAARARGLGTAWTTIHLMFEEPIAEILGIPYAEVTQVGLSPLAFTVGTDFRPAKNRGLDGVLHVDRW